MEYNKKSLILYKIKIINNQNFKKSLISDLKTCKKL
jgi:hypothetical protein